MITLYQFFPAFDVPSPSPFCLKLETYLKMANIDYENRYTANPRNSPNGKFPAIRDGDVFMSDSGLIIEYLKKQYGDPLDQSLTAEQKAQALCLQRLMEEHLYWGIVYTRWSEEQGWKELQSVFFGKLPLLLKLWLPKAIRRKILNQISGHGLGRQKPDDLYQLCYADIDCLATLLGDKPYFRGEQVTSIDACAYGTIANLVASSQHSKLTDYAKRHQNLIDFSARMQQAYW